MRDRDLRWASWFRTFAPAELAAVLSPDLREHATPERLAAPLVQAISRYGSRVGDGRLQLLGDLGTYLPDNMLLRSDKVLMAASLEGRMPLLDHRVVERVSDVPASARAGLRRGKAILRAAVADLVPSEVLNAPKRGFPVPVARFLAGGAESPLGRLLLSERALDRGLLDPDAVRALVRDETGGGDRELKVFAIGSLELWLRQNVDELRRHPATSFDDLLDNGGLARRLAAVRPARDLTRMV